MRRLVLGTVVLVLALCLPAGALAADPQIAALKRQVAALQKQVKALKTTLTETNRELTVNFEADTCLGAQTADLLQGTWLVLDQVAGRTIFGPQSPVSDYQNCSDLAKPDVPRPGIKTPPTISPFLPLLEWMHEPIG